MRLELHGCPSCNCGLARCPECGWVLPGHDESLHLPIEQWCSRSSVVRAIKADEKKRGTYDRASWQSGHTDSPPPLAEQARELLIRNRELEATVARVREVADEIHQRGTAEVEAMDDEPDEYRKNQNASRASTYARAEHLIRQALDGGQ